MRTRTDLDRSAVPEFFTEWEQAAATKGRSPDHRAGLEIAGRCLPAGDEKGRGDDWYDVIPLGPDQFGLVIGDAMGPGSRPRR
jgi:serine phosphatase RsbU (regulator of sigma subunit)